uniref:Uncharacterized protein n=1 Tax=Rhizophora mucronata TaxID=61149 RepID=A0A2P2J3R7_RHIMU
MSMCDRLGFSANSGIVPESLFPLRINLQRDEQPPTSEGMLPSS